MTEPARIIVPGDAAAPAHSPAVGIPAALRHLKVLLVHDWMLGWWGSERVVEQILRVFPHAHLASAIVDRSIASRHLPGVPLRELWMGKLPGARRWYQWSLPLEALAFGTLPSGDYDLVISSSHALAKAVRPGRLGIHLCYCHSPPRYLWDQFRHYYDRSSVVRRLALHWARAPLQRLDRATARRVTHFVTNSRFVARRVAGAYGRTARVIHPPVEAKHGNGRTSGARGDFLLYLGRLVPYKRVDLIVEAARRLGVRTVIAGEGPELGRLRAMAPANVEFAGRVPDADAAALLAGCAAFVFCAEEDFGIAPVEANAHGAPVVALRAGGIVESMRDGETGTLFDEPTVDALCAAVRRTLQRGWDEHVLRLNAARFGASRFRTEFARAVADAIDGRRW